MKYEYITATGKQGIEVDEQFYSALMALDREEYNSDRKHHRHNPISLSSAYYDGEWMKAETDILGDLIRADDLECLHETFPLLTLKQQALVKRIFLNHEKIMDIARKDGVSEAAIRNRLGKIYRRLKKKF